MMPCSRKRSSRIRQGGSSWQWMAESVDRDDAMPVCFALLCPSRLIRNPIHQAFGRTIMPCMGPTCGLGRLPMPLYPKVGANLSQTHSKHWFRQRTNRTTTNNKRQTQQMATGSRIVQMSPHYSVVLCIKWFIFRRSHGNALPPLIATRMV